METEATEAKKRARKVSGNFLVLVESGDGQLSRAARQPDAAIRDTQELMRWLTRTYTEGGVFQIVREVGRVTVTPVPRTTVKATLG